MKAAFTADEKAMRASISEFSGTMQRTVSGIASMQAQMQESVTQMQDSVSRMTAQNQKIVDGYVKVQEEALRNLQKSEKDSASFWVACNQTMQNYLQEAAKAYQQFEKSNAASEKALKAIAFIYQKNEKLLEEYPKRLTELQTAQNSVNESLEAVRRVFSQMDVAGTDGKQIILYPGMAARLSRESEQRILNRVETMLDASEERQGEVLDEIREDVRDLNSRASKKGKWFS